MAASTQILLQNENKVIYKFHSDASESDVKKVDVSTLTWAKHTLTLSGASTEKFKIGEVISTAASHSAVGDGSEFFIVTGFTASATTVEVIGWDYTNKKAASASTAYSNADKIVGSVSGLHTETAANSGTLIEQDYELTVVRMQWITSGLDILVEWDGSDAEAAIATLSGGGSWNAGSQAWPGIPVNATGDSGGVLGDIQFSTIGHGGTDSYTVWMECHKVGGYDIPQYEQNATLGFPVDYKLGNYP